VKPIVLGRINNAGSLVAALFMDGRMVINNCGR
jgi:hypothetical protein